jgi:hypothetical protein
MLIHFYYVLEVINIYIFQHPRFCGGQGYVEFLMLLILF